MYNKLNEKERLSLRSILRKYETLFDGTLGKWKRKPVSLNIKPNAKLVQSRPFSVPHFHQEKLTKEIKRLCDIGVLRKNPTAQFSSPSFIIPKKDMTIRFVSDFWKINQVLERAPFRTPKIKDLLESLSGFK